MRKKKIFLGGYINHINAQNINCKSIAKHLDKEKYIIKTLVLGSENIPSISRVSYIRVSTFLYSVSNLIAFLRAVLWADVCYVPKHQSTPKIALKIASLVGTKLFTTIEGNMCDTSKRNMINSFGSLDKMKRYFSLIPNVFGITNYIVENATCGINFQKESLSLGVEKNMFDHELKRESLRNIIFIGSLLISIPAEIIFSINNLADPSSIGTSSLSISTMTLSIPKPNKAHIKCSIVEILTPNSFSIVVFNEVLVTFIKFGYIKLFSFKSTLLKTIPVLGTAGVRQTFASNPLCKATPLNETLFFTVF